MDKIDIETLSEWDAADILTTPSLQADYLSLVMEDGDEAEIAHALEAIARARARSASPDELKTDSEFLPGVQAKDGAVTISHAMALVKSMGMKLSVATASDR